MNDPAGDVEVGFVADCTFEHSSVLLNKVEIDGSLTRCTPFVGYERLRGNQRGIEYPSRANCVEMKLPAAC